MPYLVTDPVPEAEADRYIVDIDGDINQVPAELDGSGMARLHYDLDSLSAGAHTALITAANMWGAGPPSDPFAFTKSLPGKPSGIGLEV